MEPSGSTRLETNDIDHRNVLTCCHSRYPPSSDRERRLQWLLHPRWKPGLLQLVVSPNPPSRQRPRTLPVYATVIPLIRISQGDLARPRDLPRTLKIQARAIPRLGSRGASTAPGSRVRLWPPQMPRPCPCVGYAVDNDGKHARGVRVPSCYRRRSACAGIHLAPRLVSSQ
jgi:hypothetical protein